MKVAIPEDNKQPGVHYAFTEEGIELPVVDVTHPAFALTLSEAEQRTMLERLLHGSVPLAGLPKPLRKLFLRFFLRGSILAQGAIRKAQGSFMSGMNTYLLKLGPLMLGSAYTKPIDRQIAAALPAMAVRLRLQDVSHLLADSLLPALSGDPRRPLQLINIAGGPAIDSLNALILLAKHAPGILAGREVSIDVLDLDRSGPTFGEAALAALSVEGGPLYKSNIAFRHIRYNWAEVVNLKHVLHEARAKGALVICSSEGGLFEYGSDEEIDANLRVLRAASEVIAVIGSVTRADVPTQKLRDTSTPATRPRGLDVFRRLASKAGWNIARQLNGHSATKWFSPEIGSAIPWL